MSLLLKTILGILLALVVVFFVWGYKNGKLENHINTSEDKSQLESRSSDEDMEKEIVEIDNSIKIIDQDFDEMETSMDNQ